MQSGRLSRLATRRGTHLFFACFQGRACLYWISAQTSTYPPVEGTPVDRIARNGAEIIAWLLTFLSTAYLFLRIGLELFPA